MPTNNTYNPNNNENTGNYKSEIIIYDKPVVGFIKNTIKMVHGLIITVGAYRTKLETDCINTYRTPLLGPELKTLKTFDDEENFESFFFFPEDRNMSPAFFKKMIDCVTRQDNYSFAKLFDELETFNCHLDKGISEEPVVCVIELFKYGFSVKSPYFYLFINWKGSIESISIKALEDIFFLQGYIGKPFVFIAGKSVKNGEVYEKVLNTRLASYRRNGIYGIDQYNEKGKYAGTTYNDGVNTYLIDKQVVPMSREEFLKFYPDAVSQF